MGSVRKQNLKRRRGGADATGGRPGNQRLRATGRRRSAAMGRGGEFGGGGEEAAAGEVAGGPEMIERMRR